MAPRLYLVETPGTTTTRDVTSPTADRGSDRLDDDGARDLRAPDAADEGVRIRWAPDEDPPYGVWWPRSRNAPAELRAVLPDVGDRMGGAVTRVSLSIDAWDTDQPGRLWAGERLVRLGWFHTLDLTAVTFGRGDVPRATLHLIPPEHELRG